MIVSIKDALKLLGITIITFCAVFVCTLFLNYNMDLVAVKSQIIVESVMMFYNAQVSMAKVVSIVSGGCLFITSVIMLIFYIKNYVDRHGKELGILKALGYSNGKIAKGFWIFGMSVFVGSLLGFCLSFLVMPTFYNLQNEDKILPEYTVHFHPILVVCLIILPTLLFALFSVCYAYMKLKVSALELLKGKPQKYKAHKYNKRKNDVETQNTVSDTPFLTELSRTTIKSRKTLVFFITFATFCYADMIQMSFSMDELGNLFLELMIIMIGIILASCTLFLAITTVVNDNTKTIAMMRTFGYDFRECSKAILGCYRPFAWLGFALGTVYQYVLMQVILHVVFADVDNVPEYSFDVKALIITLISFVVIYELFLYCYTQKIKRISLKEIMLES